MKIRIWLSDLIKFYYFSILVPSPFEPIEFGGWAKRPRIIKRESKLSHNVWKTVFLWITECADRGSPSLVAGSKSILIRCECSRTRLCRTCPWTLRRPHLNLFLRDKEKLRRERYRMSLPLASSARYIVDHGTSFWLNCKESRVTHRQIIGKRLRTAGAGRTVSELRLRAHLLFIGWLRLTAWRTYRTKNLSGLHAPRFSLVETSVPWHRLVYGKDSNLTKRADTAGAHRSMRHDILLPLLAILPQTLLIIWLDCFEKNTSLHWGFPKLSWCKWDERAGWLEVARPQTCILTEVFYWRRLKHSSWNGSIHALASREWQPAQEFINL